MSELRTSFRVEPDCIKLTRENLPTFEWLPIPALIGCWRKVKIYLRGIRYYGFESGNAW